MIVKQTFRLEQKRRHTHNADTNIDAAATDSDRPNGTAANRKTRQEARTITETVLIFGSNVGHSDRCTFSSATCNPGSHPVGNEKPPTKRTQLQQQ